MQNACERRERREILAKDENLCERREFLAKDEITSNLTPDPHALRSQDLWPSPQIIGEGFF